MFEAWRNLGYTYIELHQPDEAVSVLQRALQLKRDDERVWNNLGTEYNEVKPRTVTVFDPAQLGHETGASVDKHLASDSAP
jgi:Flp pilus assembly protein TadD